MASRHGRSSCIFRRCSLSAFRLASRIIQAHGATSACVLTDRETLQQISTPTLAKDAAPASPGSPAKPPAKSQPSPESVAHAVSCSSLSGSECAATRVADSPLEPPRAEPAPAAAAAESVVSPRAVAAALVRIGACTPDAITSAAGSRGGGGGLQRRSGSSEQCRPEPTTQAALAQQQPDAGSPTPASGAAGQVSPAGQAAPAAGSAPKWTPYEHLPAPALQSSFHGGGTPTQQQRGLPAAAAAVQGLDTSTILRQAAALTASGAGNRLFDLVAPGLLAMHQQHQHQQQQHQQQQQHGFLAGPERAVVAPDPRSPSHLEISQAVHAALQPAGFRTEALLQHGVDGGTAAGANSLVLLQLQQQLAVAQHHSGHLGGLFAPQSAVPGHQHPHATEFRHYSVQQGVGGGMSTLRLGLQSTSLPTFPAPHDRSSGRRVVSGNEGLAPAALPQGAVDRRAGFGGGQAVTVEDMQQVAAALVERHREAMAQQAPRHELALMDKCAEQCVLLWHLQMTVQAEQLCCRTDLGCDQ